MYLRVVAVGAFGQNY